MSVCLIQQLGIFVRSLDLVQVLRTIGSKVGLSASSDFVIIANQPTIPTSASSGLKSCSMILPKKAFTFRRRDRACNKLKLGVSSHLWVYKARPKALTIGLLHHPVKLVQAWAWSQLPDKISSPVMYGSFKLHNSLNPEFNFKPCRLSSGPTGLTGYEI